MGKQHSIGIKIDHEARGFRRSHFVDLAETRFIYLQLGRYFQRDLRIGANQASLVSIEESVNQAGIDPLAPIIEEGSETDTSSEFSLTIWLRTTTSTMTMWQKVRRTWSW